MVGAEGGAGCGIADVPGHLALGFLPFTSPGPDFMRMSWTIHRPSHRQAQSTALAVRAAEGPSTRRARGPEGKADPPLERSRLLLSLGRSTDFLALPQAVFSVSLKRVGL